MKNKVKLSVLVLFIMCFIIGIFVVHPFKFNVVSPKKAEYREFQDARKSQEQYQGINTGNALIVADLAEKQKTLKPEYSLFQEDTRESPKRFQKINAGDSLNVFDLTKEKHKKKSIFAKDNKAHKRGKEIIMSRVLNDYKIFPCVPGLVPSPELVQEGACVRTISKDLKEHIIRSRCVFLRIMEITPICVYESKKDKYISGSIIRSGEFEGGMVRNLMQVLTSKPKMEFLDLGCNIGIYTITAAKLARRVVSVDPLIENIRMLSKSLNLGKIHENVTLIWNAVSDFYSVVSFTKYKGNVGGTAIKSFVQSETVEDNDVARTIRLDDITGLFAGKQIVIKMDVETQELAVLKGGTLFFKHVDVQVVQMEFDWHKDKPSGKDIIDIMEQRGLLPFMDAFGTIPLKTKKYNTWPGDMYFVKQN